MKPSGPPPPMVAKAFAKARFIKGTVAKRVQALNPPQEFMAGVMREMATFDFTQQPRPEQLALYYLEIHPRRFELADHAVFMSSATSSYLMRQDYGDEQQREVVMDALRKILHSRVLAFLVFPEASRQFVSAVYDPDEHTITWHDSFYNAAGYVAEHECLAGSLRDLFGVGSEIRRVVSQQRFRQINDDDEDFFFALYAMELFVRETLRKKGVAAAEVDDFFPLLANPEVLSRGRNGPENRRNELLRCTYKNALRFYAREFNPGWNGQELEDDHVMRAVKASLAKLEEERGGQGTFLGYGFPGTPSFSPKMTAMFYLEMQPRGPALVDHTVFMFSFTTRYLMSQDYGDDEQRRIAASS
ncbi:hypothetical protein H9P43_005577 [Blastocladiella emersonii ATCC 22665]|nr:hypothetical protein H9P43_005577 [Blastocladiella emersonii ATCC 22665]